MRAKTIVALLAFVLAGSLTANGAKKGQENNDKFMIITGIETPETLIEDGTYTFLKSGNVKLRGKIQIYDDQFPGYPQFGGAYFVTSNCNIGCEGMMQCWGSFWPTNEPGSGNFIGTWEGRFDAMFNGSYKAVCHGVGPLEGYEARVEASYPSGELEMIVFPTHD